MLFPRPRQIVETGRGPGPGALEVRVEPDVSLAPEGYALDIGPDGIVIAHRDERGLRYARATLDQLVEASPAGLPGLSIRDWPDFPIRGYMLDVSRDRVPTRETLARLVGLCSLARINHFELYTEHTFAYADHEVVWRDASPMTADDIRRLDETCAASGIELVANQNCFGHMGRWLAHEPYRSWAEAPDGFEPIPGYRMAPTVLAPTPENAAFAQTLFAELLPNIGSRRRARAGGTAGAARRVAHARNCRRPGTRRRPTPCRSGRGDRSSAGGLAPPLAAWWAHRQRRAPRSHARRLRDLTLRQGEEMSVRSLGRVVGHAECGSQQATSSSVVVMVATNERELSMIVSV
jgi:Glycosyl hydrolase family 20, domain 2